MAEEHVVSAYCENEEERAAARSVLRDAVEYEGVVEGVADVNAVEELKRRRIMIAYAEPRERQAAEEDPLGRPSKRTDPDLQDRLRELEQQIEAVQAAPQPLEAAAPGDEESTFVEGGLLGVAPEMAASDIVPTSEESAPAPQAYRVTLTGPMSGRWREELKEHGLEISGYRRGAYEMVLDPQQLETVRALPWVKEVRPYELVDSVSTGLLLHLQEKQQEIQEGVAILSAEAEPERETFDAVVHRERDLPRVREVLQRSADAEVVEESRFAIRFRTTVDSPTIALVANLPEVRTVVSSRRPELFSDRAREIVGLTKVNAALPPKQWTGEGEVVAVLDSGIDDTHPDFAGQILRKISWRDCATDDAVGHGTHVAGIIAGTGKKSDGKIIGIASGAKLVIVGIVDDEGRPALPLDIGELLKVAADAGAKIINASWGRPLGSSYDSGSASVDRFVHEHPDILVVVAAGNDGKAPDGKYKFSSIGAPATAKNVLTVGACNTDRPGIDKTWGQFRQQLFPKPDASNDPTAGSADLVAGISSRGPTDYDSVKPDVIAPGTYILAPRAKKFAITAWMGFENNDYAYVGGTSMATPVVSGSAAVLREYLRKERNTDKPSAALLKAILICSTHKVPARKDAVSTQIGYPDFDQGFGRIDLSAVIPDDSDPNQRRLTFVDVANDSPLALESRVPPGAPRKSMRTYTLNVVGNAPAPLVVTLAWTDPAGNDIQNNLHLDVRGPNELFLVGNATHVFRKDPLFDAEPNGIVFDKRNNVEQIRIDAAVLGTYLVRVTAHNTVVPPQGYAIAALGNIKGELI
jgi:subtilisin family serine protease